MCNWMQLEKICTELHIQRPLHLFLLSALHLPHCHHHQVPSQTTVKHFPLFKSSIPQAQCIINTLSFESSISLSYIYREIFIHPCFIFATCTPSVFRLRLLNFLFFISLEKKSPHPYLGNFKTRQNRFHVWRGEKHVIHYRIIMIFVKHALKPWSCHSILPFHQTVRTLPAECLCPTWSAPLQWNVPSTPTLHHGLKSSTHFVKSHHLCKHF